MSVLKILSTTKRKINRIFIGIPTPTKWVFIVGCYNSGTTLLHEILSKHPCIGSMPSEGQFFTDVLKLPKKYGYKRLWALNPDLFQLDETNKTIDTNKLKKDWAVMYNDVTRPVLIEKSPTNAGRMRWLQENFENAYFIAIIRNGYAVSEGIRRKTGHSIDKCSRQWYVSNKIMLQDIDEIQNKLLIKYEDLTLNTTKEIRQIYNFLGLEPIINNLNKSLEIHERKETISNKNKYSFANLSNEDISTIEQNCKQLLDRFDYSLSE